MHKMIITFAVLLVIGYAVGVMYPSWGQAAIAKVKG